MAIPKISANRIFEFIVGDFEATWAGLVDTKGYRVGAGNFMFALLAMIILEFACRICAKDKTNKKLTNLTNALKKIEPRYFTPLPGLCSKTNEFTLPGRNPNSHLLGMIFDLVRNGKAHQYQSAIVTLSDGDVDIDLTGAASDRGLTRRGRRRSRNHLRYKLSSSGDLSLYVRTDQLFLDIKKAIERSKIISPTDVVADITRPRSTKPYYMFTVVDLERQLKVGGHVKGHW